jgi:hypothetical protein
MLYIITLSLSSFLSCMADDKNNEIEKDNNHQDTSTLPVDTGVEDTSDLQLPLDGFGEIEGECGLLLETPINSTAFVVQNSIDFGSLILNDEDLSVGSQEILSDGNLNNGSLYSEIFAFEMLYRCETATVLQTETEIEYDDPNGKKTDLIIAINQQYFGISVTRAFNYPPEDPYTQEAAVTLLEDKLSDIELSSANVSNPTWERQILSIIAYSPEHVSQITSAWDNLDDNTKGNTIIYVTATNGDDQFLY